MPTLTCSHTRGSDPKIWYICSKYGFQDPQRDPWMVRVCVPLVFGGFLNLASMDESIYRGSRLITRAHRRWSSSQPLLIKRLSFTSLLDVGFDFLSQFIGWKKPKQKSLRTQWHRFCTKMRERYESFQPNQAILLICLHPAVAVIRQMG